MFNISFGRGHCAKVALPQNMAVLQKPAMPAHDIDSWDQYPANADPNACHIEDTAELKSLLDRKTKDLFVSKASDVSLEYITGSEGPGE